MKVGDRVTNEWGWPGTIVLVLEGGVREVGLVRYANGFVGNMVDVAEQPRHLPVEQDEAGAAPVVHPKR